MINKWLTLLASCCLGVAAFAAGPIAIANPTLKNVGITAALGIFALLGIIIFFRSGRVARSQNGFRPVD